jgi:hypothetical protein
MRTLIKATNDLCQAIDEYTIEVGRVERGEITHANQGRLYEYREEVGVFLNKAPDQLAAADAKEK